MKPERIQFAPPMGGASNVPEPDWTATIKVGRTFELEPLSQVPFLAGVLHRAQSLPNPPKVTFVIEANQGEQKGYVTSLGLEWGDGSPMTDVEIDFVRWVSGLHDHLTVAPVATN